MSKPCTPCKRCLETKDYRHCDIAYPCYTDLGTKTFAICIRPNAFRQNGNSFSDLNPLESAKYFNITASEMMEIWAKVCELAHKSPSISTGREDSDLKRFPRYEVKIVRVPMAPPTPTEDKEADEKQTEINKAKTACVLLYFAFGDSLKDEEDVAAQLEIDTYVGETTEEDSPAKAAMKANKRSKIKEKYARRVLERRKFEDPIHALHWAIRKNEGAVDENEKGKAVRPFTDKSEKNAKRRWVDKLTKVEFARAMGAYCRSAERRVINSTHIHEEWSKHGKGENPLNPYEACSIENACMLAQQAGGDPMIANPLAFRGFMPFGGWPEPEEDGRVMHEIQRDVFELSLGECIPDNLLNMRFPWHNDPSDQQEDIKVRDDVAKQFMALDDSSRDGYDEAFAEKIATMRATNSIKLASQRVRKGMTMAGVAEKMTQWNKEELLPLQIKISQCQDEESIKQAVDEAAQKKLELQLRGLKLSEDVLNPNGNVPIALRNICLAYDEIIHKNPAHNVCMPLPHNFKNLTFFGAVLAYMAMCLEKILGVAVMHKECILATLCEYELYSGEKMHIHLCLIGDAMTGKSYVIIYRIVFSVPGTSMRIDSITVGVFGSANTDDINYMHMRTEELSPSIVGSQPGGSDKSGNAMNDKSSIIRNILTSGKYGFSRLGRGGEFEDYERKTSEVEVQIVITSAMNPPKDGHKGMPPNMVSRLLVVPVTKRIRKGTSVQSKIIGSKLSGAKDRQYQKYKDRQIRDHCVVAKHQLLIQMKCLDPINESVTDNFLVDFMNNLVKGGLAAASDIRNFEKTRQLTRICAICDGVWTYFDSEGPGCMDHTVAMTNMHWIALNTLTATAMQHLVYAVTISGDQFEDPIMDSICDPLKRFLGVAGYEMSMARQLTMAQEIEEQARKQKATFNRQKGKERKVEAKKGGPRIVIDYMAANGKATTINGVETVHSQLMRRQDADYDQTYYSKQWIDKHNYMDDEKRCSQLADEIYHTMKRKPAMNHLRGFLGGLLKEMTEDRSVDDGTMVPVMQFIEGTNHTKRIYIAKNFIDGAESNRLLSILAGMLDNPGLPQIEYFTGIPEMETPFVFRTIIPLAVRDKRRVNELALNLSNVHIGQRPDEGKEEKKAEHKKYYIRNHAWVDKAVAVIVERTMEYNPDDKNQAEESFHMSFDQSLTGPAIELNGDFEDWGTYKDLSEKNKNNDVLMQLGFGNTDNQIERVMSRKNRYKWSENDNRLKQRFVYPHCFLSRDPNYIKRLKLKKTGKRTAAEVHQGHSNDPDEEVVEATIGDPELSELLDEHEYSTGINDETSRYKNLVNPKFARTTQYRETEGRMAARKKITEKNKEKLMQRGERQVIQETPINSFGGGSGPARGMDEDYVEATPPRPAPPAPPPQRLFNNTLSKDYTGPVRGMEDSKSSTASSMSIDEIEDPDEAELARDIEIERSMSTGLDPDESTVDGWGMPDPQPQRAPSLVRTNRNPFSFISM